tara:strand:+ start:3184 stop:4563 length:1380 start_codon:yes stop_codon:yes gene_type:complete
MSINLSKDEILNRLKDEEYYNIDLEKLLKITYKNTLVYIDKLVNNEYLVDYNKDNCVNPIIWQFGHIIDFYIKNTINWIEYRKHIKFKMLQSYIIFIEKRINTEFHLYYDSIIPKHLKLRYNTKYIISVKTLKTLYKSIFKILLNYIRKNKIDKIDNYLIFLSILHNEMHIENFIFICYYLNLDMNSILRRRFISMIDYRVKNEIIKIEGGVFMQGNIKNKHNFTFDNECPMFLKTINEFAVSKYPVTEYEYLDFVKAGGYTNDKYWTLENLEWRNSNNITMPFYWFYENGNYYKKHWNEIVLVGSNIPMCNISWYEAKAYCKWKGFRLMKEEEWEYLATNKGTTLFPWGDAPIDKKKANLGYEYNYCVDVHMYEAGNNYNNISQLIGNIWEWCEESIYPYDNFVIDPVYKEMSYPFFGFKKICRGGCWAVNDFIINSKYRNAQYPDCHIQFIGFRVCI